VDGEDSGGVPPRQDDLEAQQAGQPRQDDLEAQQAGQRRPGCGASR
jgi:hypothetical protein